ncbi:MAG TPA: RNA methyltransferase [Aggregatilineales bacterium]|nr:RNA methyltransferase [Aggregatilineales bacterium]
MITSPQNSKVKLIRALLTQGKARRREKQLVLEGVRLVDDVFQQGYIPYFALYHPDFADPLLDQLQAQNVECLPLEARLFEELSDTEQPQGILAVYPMPDLRLPSSPELLLAIDAVRDPGNLGTILRTAAAAGVDGVILLPGTVDVFNPKVIRGGMGAHFRLPLLTASRDFFAEQFGDQSGTNWNIRCADAGDPNAISYLQADLWQPPCILIIGSEAHGISPETRQQVQKSVFIPMESGVESLNSSIAAAILLFEIRRQRSLP